MCLGSPAVGDIVPGRGDSHDRCGVPPYRWGEGRVLQLSRRPGTGGRVRGMFRARSHAQRRRQGARHNGCERRRSDPTEGCMSQQPSRERGVLLSPSAGSQIGRKVPPLCHRRKRSARHVEASERQTGLPRHLGGEWGTRRYEATEALERAPSRRSRTVRLNQWGFAYRLAAYTKPLSVFLGRKINY